MIRVIVLMALEYRRNCFLMLVETVSVSVRDYLVHRLVLFRKNVSLLGVTGETFSKHI